MIYFESYRQGRVGLNNQLISYTLCLSLSEFFDRDFFFDYDRPSIMPPPFAVEGDLKDKFEILLTSPRSLITDVVDMPARRVSLVDRETTNKIRAENLQLGFLTTRALKAKYEGTVIWDQFNMGRSGLVKEDLDPFELIEIGDYNLINISYFYLLAKAEKKALLDSIKIKYKKDIEDFAGRIRREVGDFYALHIRMGDFFQVYGRDGYRLVVDRFRQYLQATLPDRSLPILIATDGLAEKEVFADILKDYSHFFIDELVFGEYETGYRELEFTDFNVLSIINQLLCAGADNFVGSYRSTFTGIIHRLRQERYQKKDFNFHPDDRLATMMTPDFTIKPNQQGFFDWNRYSIGQDGPSHLAWAREWNFDFTAPGF